MEHHSPSTSAPSRCLTLAEEMVWRERLTDALRGQLLRARLPICEQALARTVSLLLAQHTRREEAGGYRYC